MSGMEDAPVVHDVYFDSDADTGFCTSSWLFQEQEERSQFSNLIAQLEIFLLYVSFIFLSTGTGRLGLLNWMGRSQVLYFYPVHSLSCPQRLWKILCNAGFSGLCVQGAQRISFQPSLCLFRQAVVSVLPLFWTSIFPRSLSTGS